MGIVNPIILCLIFTDKKKKNNQRNKSIRKIKAIKPNCTSYQHTTIVFALLPSPANFFPLLNKQSWSLVFQSSFPSYFTLVTNVENLGKVCCSIGKANSVAKLGKLCCEHRRLNRNVIITDQLKGNSTKVQSLNLLIKNYLLLIIIKQKCHIS